MVVYSSAVHITVSGSTDNADKALAKIVELFTSIGMRYPTTPPIQFYRSHIVCDFDKSLDLAISKFEQIASILQTKMGVAAKMQATGFAFSADQTTLPASVAAYNPTLFTVSRKTEVPFSTNRYLCFANLKTSDHLAALAGIEQLF